MVLSQASHWQREKHLEHGLLQVEGHIAIQVERWGRDEYVYKLFKPIQVIYLK